MIACACAGIGESPRNAAVELEKAIHTFPGPKGSQIREILVRFPLNHTARPILDTFIQIPTEPIPIGGHPFLDDMKPDPRQGLYVS